VNGRGAGGPKVVFYKHNSRNHLVADNLFFYQKQKVIFLIYFFYQYTKTIIEKIGKLKQQKEAIDAELLMLFKAVKRS